MQTATHVAAAFQILTDKYFKKRPYFVLLGFLAEPNRFFLDAA